MKERKIIHVDMDAFFAAVEMRDNPELVGKPLIIGALPTERGVVSTCSYEARKYGVHSAMNIKEAYRRCPHGIFMHGNMKKYAEASKKIHEIMLNFTDKIEFVALDEGYMDVTDSIMLFGSAENIGRQLKEQIFKQVGVTCSVGISYSMMSAKIPSEEKKPDAVFVIPNEEEFVKLIYDRPVGVINGIGKKTTERLNRIGILTVGDLLNLPEENTLDMFGVMGKEMRKIASGEDNREVVPESMAKSIGREHTFQQDISDKEVLKSVLLLLAGDVGYRLKKKGMWSRTVTLKIKFSDMQGITRSKSGAAVNSVKDIFSGVSLLFDALDIIKPIRLIGVSVSNLQNTKEEKDQQISLFDEINEKEEIREQKTEALEDVVFKLHNQYGRGILKTAKELEAYQKISENKDKIKP